MLTPPAPDLFVNVHKGLRKALFDLVLALGRAEASLFRPGEPGTDARSPDRQGTRRTPRPP
jgi:hypothetical protein